MSCLSAPTKKQEKKGGKADTGNDDIHACLIHMFWLLFGCVYMSCFIHPHEKQSLKTWCYYLSVFNVTYVNSYIY